MFSMAFTSFKWPTDVQYYCARWDCAMQFTVCRYWKVVLVQYIVWNCTVCANKAEEKGFLRGFIEVYHSTMGSVGHKKDELQQLGQKNANTSMFLQNNYHLSWAFVIKIQQFHVTQESQETSAATKLINMAILYVYDTIHLVYSYGLWAVLHNELYSLSISSLYGRYHSIVQSRSMVWFNFIVQYIYTLTLHVYGPLYICKTRPILFDFRKAESKTVQRKKWVMG